MIEVKTSELIGPALDWAVAKCVYEKAPATLPFDEFLKGSGLGNWGLTESEQDEIQALKDGYSPSTDWSQGGPLIDEYSISIIKEDGKDECAAYIGLYVYYEQWDYTAIGLGQTLLIAAMRCLCAAKLGDTVQVPAELLETV